MILATRIFRAPLRHIRLHLLVWIQKLIAFIIFLFYYFSGIPEYDVQLFISPMKQEQKTNT
jgi:hypothetical protein